jgi:hypothetical protein
MVVHIYNSICSVGREWEDSILRPTPSKKLARPPSQQISWSWWYVPVIPAKQDTIDRRI